MPRRTRPGQWAVLFAEIPPPLKAKLDARAGRNRRSTTAELIVLLEAALATEPDAPAPEPKKPTRKPKKPG